ncbi:hypothetical protein CpB1040 [Chlamydia pneumoniae TW-183]|uniref:Uncharacterized protein n=2 Tax=Chlamydia pneumoniae TaxID=83558 RepID=Q9Z6Q7_CHLPN|nr:hypothetical protein [Chlamydia pneumoniae]AAD19139.1 CT845 hypothetical protein [Chlamydia pneumoniae CWL029]AAF38641.1 conserved hypothetical protein [Chlamydia pneumoniae AR39]AAP98969.1 hypothetical protein CpB1040 [Chlamydia pneumoniae TW-183]ACZ32905.1 conserved hypothetical protein [Chlamydia pneumoniae LPCoLN]ETR79787.1 hypothetical protein X556_0892 [Chlamydia pneumoniae B21]
MKNKIVTLLDQLYEDQESRLQKLGEEIVPNLTPEDLLQPMDFPQLEGNPAFRFEEGVLSGIGEVRAAILAALSQEN